MYPNKNLTADQAAIASKLCSYRRSTRTSHKQNARQ